MNLLLDDYSIVSLVVLGWLSLYFILVIWIFFYRYIILSSSLSRENEIIKAFLMGRSSALKSSLLFSELKEFDLEPNSSLLKVMLDEKMKSLTGGLTFLAIVASTAPFIGLFGTVVEILDAFSNLGLQGKATLDIIAPVISKALIATAAGILTAIPAYTFSLFLKRKAFELQICLQLELNLLINHYEKNNKDKH